MMVVRGRGPIPGAGSDSAPAARGGRRRPPGGPRPAGPAAGRGPAGGPTHRHDRRQDEARPLPTPKPVAAENLIYGVNPVREALRGRRRVRVVWISAEAAARGLDRSVREWSRAAGVAEPRIVAAPVEDLVVRGGTLDHQGIVAEVEPYIYVADDVLLREHTLLLALDRVQDPQNLGAALRCAEAAGAGVVIPRHRAASVTPAAVKASAGASEHVAVAQVRNLADFLEEAQGAGFWVYGAAMDAPVYYAGDFIGPTVFVLGSEGEGLGRRVASVCDALVGIPQAGRIQSLNVSVAAGVLLFEAMRQRASAEVPT